MGCEGNHMVSSVGGVRITGWNLCFWGIIGYTEELSIRSQILIKLVSECSIGMLQSKLDKKYYLAFVFHVANEK